MWTRNVGYSMLKLTKKADYGLMAMKFLAEHPETPALSAKDIADAYGIPAQLLAKILQRLTKTGLLRSHAGMNGGYALARMGAQQPGFGKTLQNLSQELGRNPVGIGDVLGA